MGVDGGAWGISITLTEVVLHSPPQLQMYMPLSRLPYSDVSATPFGSVMVPTPNSTWTDGISPAADSTLKSLDRTPFVTVKKTICTTACLVYQEVPSLREGRVVEVTIST